MELRHLIFEVEGILTSAGQMVIGELDINDLRRRLCALWRAPHGRLCPPPCRPRHSEHDIHVNVAGRCCEASRRWSGPRQPWLRDSDPATTALAAEVVLLAERDGPADLQPRLQALAAVLLAEGLVTAPEDCAKGSR